MLDVGCLLCVAACREFPRCVRISEALGASFVRVFFFLALLATEGSAAVPVPAPLFLAIHRHFFLLDADHRVDLGIGRHRVRDKSPGRREKARKHCTPWG